MSPYYFFYSSFNQIFKNVGVTNISLIAIASIILVFAFRAWRSRIQGGDYEFSTKESAVIFESELGKFIFDKKKKSFEAYYNTDKKIVLPFNEIKNIEIITEDVYTMFADDFFPNVSSFAPEYRDINRKHAIAVTTKNFQNYPLIVLTQFTPIQVLWGIYLMQLQLDLLSLVGLYIPIEIYAQDLYVKFKVSLEQDFIFDKYKI